MKKGAILRIAVAVSRQLTCVDALVRVQRGLLAEALHAQIALERTFTGMRSHVHLQVRFAAECRFADLHDGPEKRLVGKSETFD